MKKIRYIWVCLALLCLLFRANAQTERITFPAEGSVFQKPGSTGHNFQFSGQYKSGVTAYYRIQKQQGSDWNNPTNITTDNSLSDIWTVGDRKGFFVNHGNLDKGWYRVRIYTRRSFLGITLKRYYKDTKEFGVGDVYFVAGQSNASGYARPNDDNNIPFFSNFSLNNKARVLPIDGKDLTTIQKGIPYTTGFEPFRSGTSVSDYRVVYPNGESSWCWAPLASKIANDPTKQTPTLFFNNARPGSTVVYDWATGENSTDMVKFRDVLKMYGNIFGAKAVLWHQGENDTQNLIFSTDQTAYLNSYSTGLDNLIKWSRKATTGSETNASLNWYVSKVSYQTGWGPNPPNPWITNGPTQTSLECRTSDTRTDITHKYIYQALKDKQTSSLGNVFMGVNADNFINTTPNCATPYRATKNMIHFTGNSLSNLADEWYTALYNNYNSTNAVAATSLIALSSVNGSGNSYTLTVPNQGSGSIYYWVKNDGHYLNGSVSSTSNTYQFNGVNSGDFLTCYVLKSDNRLYPCQPFVVPGGTTDAQSLDVSNNDINFASSGETKETTVLAKNVEWDIASYSSWLTLNYDDDNSKILISAPANGGAARPGTITLQQVGGTLTKNINLSQSAPSSSTYLTDLPNTYFTGDGYTPKQNLSVINNTLRMGGTYPSVGQSYSKGVGTHSFMTITYNLNGQYTNLTGLVGIDDEVDATSDANTHTAWASIELDGVEVWNSGTVLKTNEAPRNINISVAGKNQIKLITNTGNGGTYNDHVDWVNMILTNGNTCTTQAPTPINVRANPATIMAGQISNLEATCTTGIPVWSSGSNTVSPVVTTTYTVNCVNGNCPISPLMETTVTVTSSNGCSAVMDGLIMGTWNVTGHQLVARRINEYNAFYLTQRTSASPESFVIRAAEMLQRGDVSLSNGSYSGLVGCFNHQYSGYGGLVPPNLANPINLNVNGTATNFNLNISQDGTNYYTQSTSTPTICNGCVGYFDGVWCPVAAGWSKDGAGNQTNLDFWIDGVKVASNIPPNNYRPDVGGQFGFNYTFPSQYLNGQNHEIRVRFANTMTDLNGSPKTFNCTGSNMRVANSENHLESELNDNRTLSVYPNPTSDKLVVAFHVKNASKVSFKIIDLKGSVKQEYSFDAPEGNHQFEMDVKELIIGSYFLNGVIENKLNIRKFFVER